MDEAALLELYEELGELIKGGPLPKEQMTDAQTYFSLSFNAASIGEYYLEVYSELFNMGPEVTLRNLHAFTLGYAIGQKFNKSFDVSTTTH